MSGGSGNGLDALVEASGLAADTWVLGALLILGFLVLGLVLAGGIRRVTDRLTPRFDEFGRDLDQSGRLAREEVAALRNAQGAEARGLREEISNRLGENAAFQKSQLDSFQRQISELREANENQMRRMRETIETRLDTLRAENSAKLDEMRRTVDEKLQGTLEKRLGESFKQVSERLEKVHTALGEMSTLATGVGDLKKVLTNVKTRGTWGEIQLGNILEMILSPGQYEANVATRPGSSERVEFAVRMPGQGTGREESVWLPIDAKFPKEDHERLVDAIDRADPEAVEAAARQLEASLRDSARTISAKYINPPHSTDFAVLFLPTESLYAEVLRRPGLAEAMQRDHRVTVAGPTTLAALLNSLQMGFRTLAIQERSSEVWKVLGGVKAEFGKFGEVLDRVRKKLGEASNVVDQAGVRQRAVERRLRDVESLPDRLGPGPVAPPPADDEA